MAAAVAASNTTQHEARKTAQAYLDQRLADSATNKSTRPFDVPEINIAKSFSSKLEDRKAVALQIRNACMNSGFFHITGHGIAEEKRQTILKAAQRFTKDYPREKKEALHVRHSPYFRGWEPADFTYVNPGDWNAAEAAPETKEGFNWGYEAGLDPTGGDGQYRELDGAAINANVWPDEDILPGFYAAVQEYYGSILQLARHLFRLFALALELEEDYFDDMMTHPGGIARLLYYPPAKDPKPLDSKVKDKEIGLGAHSDYECFTILLTSTAAGLEILSPENQWIAAPFVEGSFIISRFLAIHTRMMYRAKREREQEEEEENDTDTPNADVADFLMRWSNGVFKSTVHRVVNRTSSERYSVPFFFSSVASHGTIDQSLQTVISTNL